MVTNSKQMSIHFHSNEFKCPHCGNIYISEKLVSNMEKLYSKLNATKCVISSGYRCETYDKQIGGFVGQHAKGMANDCIFYDTNGKIIPSKIVICVANDLGIFNGIAKINENYTHLDVRTSGSYKGDETKSNSSCWTNPYSYFGVSKEDVSKYTGEVIYVPNDVNVYYRVKTEKHGWLSEVKNLEDFAGLDNSPITALCIKVDNGSIKYRVTTVSGKTFSFVSGYDINDTQNGYAGNGKEAIATVEVEYYTPNDIRPFKYAKYKVNNYSWQKDLIKGNGMDGYAGAKGVAMTKFQIVIE